MSRLLTSPIRWSWLPESCFRSLRTFSEFMSDWTVRLQGSKSGSCPAFCVKQLPSLWIKELQRARSRTVPWRFWKSFSQIIHAKQYHKRALGPGFALPSALHNFPCLSLSPWDTSGWHLALAPQAQCGGGCCSNSTHGVTFPRNYSGWDVSQLKSCTGLLLGYDAVPCHLQFPAHPSLTHHDAEHARLITFTW